MSVVDAVAAVMFAAVILYAVFGGADFGSGVWDLTAGRDERGAPMRRLIDHAIGPVWEANHVWLIFILVFLWTGFPQPFAALMGSLAVPFWLAALGIVARGAGFAFRKYAPTLAWARLSGVIFAASSLITPFFLGMIAGAIASGRVPGPGEPVAGPFEAWLGPTSFLGGALAVSTCTFTAGVLLSADADRLGDTELAEQIRFRSLIGAAITGAVVLTGIPILVADDETLIEGLLGRAFPLVIISAIAGLTTARLLWKRQYRTARLGAGVAVASVVGGWGVAQYPWLLVDQITLEDGAGARTALIGLLAASGLAAVLVVPPLVYLYRLADTNRVGDAKPAASAKTAEA